MDHHKAIDSNAAERYILGELNGEDRDTFEEHFFDCPTCSMSVRDAAKVRAAVRLGQPHGAALPRSRMHWGWAAAASVLVAGLVYESIKVPPTLPHAPIAARLAQPVVLDSPSRGPGEDVVVKAHPEEAVQLTIVIPAGYQYPVYVLEVRDSAGRKQASLSVPRADANEAVPMVISSHTLSSGRYKLVIRGGDREIAAYPFVVEVR